MIQSYNYLKQYGGDGTEYTKLNTTGVSEEQEKNQANFEQDLEFFLGENKTKLSDEEILKFKDYVFDKYKNSDDENLNFNDLLNNYLLEKKTTK